MPDIHVQHVVESLVLPSVQFGAESDNERIVKCQHLAKP